MSVPKICGLETEYGLLVADPHRLGQEDAALALLARCPLEPRVEWDLSRESPGHDAREERLPPANARLPLRVEAAAGNHAGFMLGNGARLYVDHGHPEYATPECADALALVASDKAGERLLERCRRHLNSLLPLGQSVRLFKNNTDHQGHSYGCHENYLIAAATYEALFRERTAELLEARLLPFLVSRIVVCGAGKVGSENGRPPVGFQISQRADFFETVLGIQTMNRRPLVNTRDEPHADAGRFRRLHIISGDANLAQLSTYLKVGTLQLLLAMLEDEAPLPDLTLADPLAAVVEISHAPTCTTRVALRDGRRLTAVEIQFAFAEAAQRYLATAPDSGSGFPAVLERWTAVLEQLAVDPLELSRSLDWAIKWKFLDDWRHSKRLDWTAAQLQELDLRYHDIDPEKSVHYILDGRGAIERLVEQEEILKAEEQPISPTRAVPRAALIRNNAAGLSGASWSLLRIGGRLHDFSNPTCSSAGEPVFTKMAGRLPIG
jgi:proteasome accessory factor A